VKINMQLDVKFQKNHTLVKNQLTIRAATTTDVDMTIPAGCKAICSSRDQKIAGLATQGNATDCLMAATGQGGTTYNGVGPFTGNFMGMGGQITPEKMEQDFKAGKTMIVSTPKDAGGLFAGVSSQVLKDQYGLESGHCYTVKRIYTDDRGQKMVELHDPTGTSQPRPVPLDQTAGVINQVAVS
jgi:hypothetical protein